MENTYLSMDELKRKYPDEWVLLGDPEMKNTSALGGVPLYHSEDRKEVFYVGKHKTADYESVTIAFAGNVKQQRRIGILRRI